MPDKVVSPEEWIEARKKFLQKEKEHTRAGDALASERRRLPMVRITKEYTFRGPGHTTASLSDLFGDDGAEQLLVYHFMFRPEDERGCAGCSHVGDSLPDVRHLRLKKTNLVCVSRAPVEKLEAFKRKAGWEGARWGWFSSGDSDFNYDFHATIDEGVAPVLVNFLNQEEMTARGKQWHAGDVPGFSVFWKKVTETGEEEIYHTYSTFARGSEPAMPTLALLDMTPLGRQTGVFGPAEFKLGYEYEAEAKGDDAAEK